MHYCCYLKKPVRLSYVHLACGSIQLIKSVRSMGNMLSYLLECYIYWNMLPYLLEYVIIFIGICYYIYWNVTISIGICYYIYCNMLLKHSKSLIIPQSAALLSNSHIASHIRPNNMWQNPVCLPNSITD